jgi:uncharacterized protein involved in exopolysaccharide biosynthesis
MTEYEIEIIDYLKLIWRKKWMIAFGTLLLVLITGVVTLFLPKTYVATAYLEIGRIAGRFIEEPMGLRARIGTAHYGEKYIQDQGLSLAQNDLRLKTASTRVGVVRLTVEGPSRDTNAEFLRYVISDSTSQHAEEYSVAIKLRDEREELLQNQIAYLESRIAEINETITDFEARMKKGETGIFVIQGALIGMETQLANLKDSYSNFTLRDLILQTYETEVLAVEVPRSHARPSLRLNVSVALFLGLLLSMAVALIREYLKREERLQEK